MNMTERGDVLTGNRAQVSVIIVAYNSGRELRALLPDLIEIRRRFPLDIFVVDNDSGDDSRKAADAFGDEVTLLCNPENVGFGAAVNRALEVVSSPYVLILNPDTRITLQAVQQLFDYLTAHPEVAAAAPRLVYPDGSLQPSRGSFPNLLIAFTHIFRLKRLLPKDEIMIRLFKGKLGKLFAQYSDVGKDQPVDYTTGACVLLDAGKLREVGCFDERFFLYYEEIDLAARLKKAGYKWMFLSSVVVEHVVAASASAQPLKPFIERYRSMVVYFRLHKPAWQVRLVVLWIRMMAMFLLVAHRFHPGFRIDPNVNPEEEKSVLRQLLRISSDVRSPS